MLFFLRSTPNLATVIPAMDHINEHLATTTLNPDYPLAIKAALAVGKTTLNCYYYKTDYSEVYRIAMDTVISVIQIFTLIKFIAQFYTLDTSWITSKKRGGSSLGLTRQRRLFVLNSSSPISTQVI